MSLRLKINLVFSGLTVLIFVVLLAPAAAWLWLKLGTRGEIAVDDQMRAVALDQASRLDRMGCESGGAHRLSAARARRSRPPAPR